jgi:cellulose synthase/poly-beta-1,6-N-acetylglucosamine synthase-like glycosyltransferase
MALWDHLASRGKPPSAAAIGHTRIRQLPAFLDPVPVSPHSDNDNQSHFFHRSPADELHCLRHLLSPALLREAEARARKLGLGADQVLIRRGAITEDAYLRCLSAYTGIETVDLATFDRTDSPLRDEQIAHAATAGLLSLRMSERLVQVVAPRLRSARTLCRAVAEDPTLTPDFRLASTASLQQFLTRQGGGALGRLATRGLHDKHPALSAAPASRRSGSWPGRARRGCAVAALLVLPPAIAPAISSSVVALWFVAFVALRLAGACWPRRAVPRYAPTPDDVLPVYSVIAALYREAASVAPLMAAINALDYPSEKLDVILVVEQDDPATRAAIASLGPMPHVRTLVAPPLAPQTKPKALNWALPFACGSFVAVFDAEDRPEIGQLRAALDAFRHHPDSVACVQASLCIDNKTHSWLSLMYAAEYAGQFDIYLSGMSEMALPLPLGGSSNHFRTAVLREVGGWDAYNVTEDADLGFRLARSGYRSVTFPSTTFEEAPIRFHAWLKQRSRWMKGWLQTWCVHMRQPRQLWRDAGPLGFATLNILAGGNILTALAYPIMLYVFLAQAWSGILAGAPAIDWPAPLYLIAFTSGCVSTIVVGAMGLARRGRLRDGWILTLTPFYWGCLSIAAWRALLQYIWNPYHWEKTEHGVAERWRTRPSQPGGPSGRLRRPHR